MIIHVFIDCPLPVIMCKLVQILSLSLSKIIIIIMYKNHSYMRERERVIFIHRWLEGEEHCIVKFNLRKENVDLFNTSSNTKINFSNTCSTYVLPEVVSPSCPPLSL